MKDCKDCIHYEVCINHEVCPHYRADVAPVAHGKWFGTVCSNCGESTSFYYDCDFCPQCGAAMDECEDEE